ncbi:hypothetical protein JW977_03510 [Candidatus Falkowbacteria bacterium]|nr:hypothetical protein [Candidatus Falkowbacteria bacterium]
MNKNLYKLFYLILISLCLLPNLAGAFSISENVNSFGQQVYGGSYTSPQQIAAVLIRTALTILGIAAVILIIYGGFIYMTAQGKEDAVKKGKNIIYYAIIGLVIIISAYAITNFVFYVIINSSQGGIFAPGGNGIEQGGTTP